MSNQKKALLTDSEMQIIDMEIWERTEHFNFFQSIKSNNYGMTVQQDVTALCNFRKKINGNGCKRRFSDILYYFATRAANAIPELRTRIVDGKPVLFDVVHPSFTYVPKGRNLHANVLARYAEKFSEQTAYFDAARENSDQSPTLMPEGGDKQNLIYFSIVAGVAFTSTTTPWGDCSYDSVPRILFGEMTKTESGKASLPIAIELLHCLADGKHIAEFFKLFNEMCMEPEKYLV
ncbi:CatA-like O-acetyltransferase [Maridesulfovibrio hydrothermalis]|uniref:Chloramphenicol acetyltransferase n=1 Tax=Maridesulfovibrio hydrothermalis AM13 = DSM 14728 TaxID=1121451 RepID=L0RBT0_9BACT|nr:CatA-like O-acetyltransferase [Maridesulfovibrio hydrothermalis]CCO24214.1 Chloramphenicol acetyltransferase [Maridesulfovibrio hydrothermalis AM13 = DSM 14728]